MNRCQLDRTQEEISATRTWRCLRCGFADRRVIATPVHPPVCRVIREINKRPLITHRGLGDTIAAVTHALGIKQADGCGCGKRQAWLNEHFPYPRMETTITRPRVLLDFHHGMGDLVQFSIVLRHLERYRHAWTFDLRTDHGMERALMHLVRRTHGPEEEIFGRYDLHRSVEWWEPDRGYDDSPSTKAEKALREIWGITPDPELCRYSLRGANWDEEIRVSQYLDEIDPQRRGIVVLHHQGTSSSANKNLPLDVARGVVEQARAHGLVPVLLDWDARSDLLRMDSPPACPGAGHPLWGSTHGTGEVNVIHELIARARLFVGIDSGPGHVAGATDTPSIIVWRFHHPVNYYCLSPNVLHVLRRDHALHAVQPEISLPYFRKHYRYHECAENVRLELPRLIEQHLRMGS